MAPGALPTFDQFLADLRSVGTLVEPAPAVGEDVLECCAGAPWRITVHRGAPLDPPLALHVEPGSFAETVRANADRLAGWWPDGDPVRRAYDALLVGFDSSLVDDDTRTRDFVRHELNGVRLTSNGRCADLIAHLDPDADLRWSARRPGRDPSGEPPGLRSRGRRHADLVRAFLMAQHGFDAVPDRVHHLLEDQMSAAFGSGVIARFSDHLDRQGLTSAELAAIAEDPARLDPLLDALLDPGPAATA